MSDPLTAAVARVIDDYSLIINIGHEAGVKRSHKFAVVDAQDEAIFDPITGDELGSIPRIKVQLKARDIYAKMTICETYLETTTGGGLGVTTMFGPEKTVLETFSTDVPAVAPETYVVSIGDRVIQIND